MRIIFIRHGDPDYINDALTEKGVREARLLSDRVAGWPVDQYDFYCSPLGRARQTASYSLEKIGKQAVTHEWMKEFSYTIQDPTTGRIGVPWDLMPEYWTGIPEMYDKEAWKKTDIYRSNEELVPAYENVCGSLDRLLEDYGYTRQHDYYVHTPRQDVNDTIVIFCHLGITCVMLSHLLGISPVLLLHGMYLAPTSVTVAATEERQNHIARFRTLMIGDVAHLLQNGEPISGAGYFTDVFEG